jgi:hypothetical protein
VYDADPPDPAASWETDGSPLWSAPLATYVDAPVAERLASLLGDASTRPERVAGALATNAVGAVLTDEGGGGALVGWIREVAAAGRVDVVAAAVQASSRDDDALNALGGFAGLADAAAAAVEACPSGDAATAASLGAMLEALPPQAAEQPGARAALANVAACRVMAARGIAATPAEVAAAAKDAAASRDFVKRVTARAVREASGANSLTGEVRGRVSSGPTSRRSRRPTAHSASTYRARTPRLTSSARSFASEAARRGASPRGGRCRTSSAAAAATRTSAWVRPWGWWRDPPPVSSCPSRVPSRVRSRDARSGRLARR